VQAPRVGGLATRGLTVTALATAALAVAGCGGADGPRTGTKTSGDAASERAKRAAQKAEFRDFTHESNVLAFWSNDSFLGPLVSDVDAHGGTVRLATKAQDDRGPASELVGLCRGTLDEFGWARRVVVRSRSRATTVAGRRGGRCHVG
jgi:hypothetical protein